MVQPHHNNNHKRSISHRDQDGEDVFRGRKKSISERFWRMRISTPTNASHAQPYDAGWSSSASDVSSPESISSPCGSSSSRKRRSHFQDDDMFDSDSLSPNKKRIVDSDVDEDTSVKGEEEEEEPKFVILDEEDGEEADDEASDFEVLPESHAVEETAIARQLVLGSRSSSRSQIEAKLDEMIRNAYAQAVIGSISNRGTSHPAQGCRDSSLHRAFPSPLIATTDAMED